MMSLVAARVPVRLFSSTFLLHFAYFYLAVYRPLDNAPSRLVGLRIQPVPDTQVSLPLPRTFFSVADLDPPASSTHR